MLSFAKHGNEQERHWCLHTPGAYEGNVAARAQSKRASFPASPPRVTSLGGGGTCFAPVQWPTTPALHLTSPDLARARFTLSDSRPASSRRFPALWSAAEGKPGASAPTRREAAHASYGGEEDPALRNFAALDPGSPSIPLALRSRRPGKGR